MDALDQYIDAHTSPEDELLKELDRQTHLRTVQPRMISGHVQGKLLELVVRMLRPCNILEIGTFTGYSALCMAAGLGEDGHLDTIEVDEELTPLSQSFFDRSPHGPKITQHVGSALDIVPKLGRTYDLVFIDGDKREYPGYYRMLMGDGPTGCPESHGNVKVWPSPDSLPAADYGAAVAGQAPAPVHSGTILIADNILWYGKVAEPVRHNDRHTEGILEFNRMVRADDRVENVILSLRDGLNIIRVK